MEDDLQDVVRIIRELKAQGWVVTRTPRGHMRVSRDGIVVIVPARSPIDWTGIRDGLAPLTRYGFRWPP